MKLKSLQAALYRIALTWEEYSKAHPRTKKTPDDPMFTKPGKGDPHQLQEKPKHQEKVDDAEAHKKETPRQRAYRKTKTQMESTEYAFARESKFTNAGEDLARSARHKRNEWKGLDEAEKDGTAEKLVTRENLMKLEPVDFMSTVDENPGTMLSSLAMYTALKRFPPEPPGPTRYPKEDHEIARTVGDKNITVGEYKKTLRKQYLESFKEVSAKAQALAKSEIEPDKAIAQLREVVSAKIKKLREDDYYNPFANTLAHFSNKVLASYARNKSSVKTSLLEFAKASKEKYGDNLADNKHAILGHVKDILDGTSMNESFGKEGTKRYRFNPAEAYVDHAERKGPPTNLNTSKKQLKYIMDNAGIRGFQWGNSVTDDEREHHLKHVADAFKDLTDVLGLPEKMASFNGRLGLAVGARGKGNALAHYEPTMVTINLTRKGGVGSLAHEYFHFWDNVMAKVMFNSSRYVTEHAEANVRYRFTPSGIEAQPEPAKDKDDKSQMQAALSAIFPKIHAFRNRMRSTESYKKMGPGQKDYYNSTIEIMARCFERYVDHKLREKGRVNTYLAGVKGGDTHLWPNDQEVKEMAPLFDNIFSTFAKTNLKTAFVNAAKKKKEEKLQEPKPDAPKFLGSKLESDPDKHGHVWLKFRMPNGDEWEYLLNPTTYAAWNTTSNAKNQGRSLAYAKANAVIERQVKKATSFQSVLATYKL